MSIAIGTGQCGHVASYEVPDNELAVGCTLGGPKVATIIKANGAIEKVFGIDAGKSLFGTMILRHYDQLTGMHLQQERPGTFTIHPSHQEHTYSYSNQLHVHENIFVLNSRPGEDGSVDIPAVYEAVELHNKGSDPIEIVTYAYVVLRGDTPHDIETIYDKKLGALIAWNKSHPELARVVGCSEQPRSFETTLDAATAVAEHYPGKLSGKTDADYDPLGVFEHLHRLEPGETVRFYYLLSFGEGRNKAVANYKSCPDAGQALKRTEEHFRETIGRCVVLTPDEYVNRGVQWAKANMLRVETKAPTGWCFTNDPTRSNNSVARDTAWFGFGGDYVTPNFVRESLSAYVKLQEKDGMIIEYYDIRNNETADYGLNINDNTPLMIMALWHHYDSTGDKGFLREIYPATARAARYMLSQRNDQGLIWCTATGTADRGIAGWRNVIPNYRLSGATTEVNSEAYSALRTVSHMARVLAQHEDSEEFSKAADELKSAINKHLYNPENGLYYLNIDINGNARSDITSDLVFPVMFGVADDRTSARIIGRLSNQDFWTTAGIRTAPRDAPDYTPSGGWGLLGGVWVGVSFWYAFAAARYAPDFMARALSTSFANYSRDPRGNNTVPGQFSEWLNGETLVNEGMMLSPWFPPRYIWAAVEGVAGFSVWRDEVKVTPRMAPNWKWMGVQNLPHRGKDLSWFAVNMPDLRIFANFLSQANDIPHTVFNEDISHMVRVTGESVVAIGLQREQTVMIMIGSTSEQTLSTSVRLECPLDGEYQLRIYESLLGEWTENEKLLPAAQLQRGITLHIERQGFCVVELMQEA